MCGLLACFNTKTNNKEPEDANDFIVNQYEDQVNRGSKGFGIIRIDKKQNIEIDRATEPVKFLLDLYMKKSNMIIAHHRTPTSTDNQIDQTHPMYVTNKLLKYDYLVVHNGLVTNDEELHKKHLELGFEYSTEYTIEDKFLKEKAKWNDSESLAIELALYIEKRVDKIGIDNAAAFIIVQINKENLKAHRIFFGRHETYSYLNLSKKKGEMKISSEGIGEETAVDKLYSFDPNDPKMKLTKIKMTFLEKPPYVRPTTGLYEKSTTDIHPATTAITPTTETTSQPTLRQWMGEDNEPKGVDELAGPNDFIIEFADKGYLGKLKTKFTENIKDIKAADITQVLNDTLEEETDTLNQIVEAYKEQVISLEYFDDKDKQEYINQICRIINGMKTITEIANDEYLQKDYEEQEAKKEFGDELGYAGYHESTGGIYGDDFREEDAFGMPPHRPVGYKTPYHLG